MLAARLRAWQVRPVRDERRDLIGTCATDASFLKGLLPPGEIVEIELGDEPRDRYSRLLGYVRRAGDGLFVNLELAISGYATDMAIPPNTTWADVFAEAVQLAEQDQASLWPVCGVMAS